MKLRQILRKDSQKRKKQTRRQNNALWWRTYLSIANIRQLDAIFFCDNELGFSIFDNVSEL